MERWRQHGLATVRTHWGVYAIPGGFWEGKMLSRSCRMDTLEWKEMPKDAYDSLYKQFNPTSFDAKAWAKQARQMERLI